MCIYVYVYMNIWIYVYVHMRKYVCVCIYMYMYVYRYLFVQGPELLSIFSFRLVPECVAKGSCFLGKGSGGWGLFAARCVYLPFLSAIALSMGNVTKGDVFQVVQMHVARPAWDFVASNMSRCISRKKRQSHCLWEMSQKMLLLKLCKCISRGRRGTLWHWGTNFGSSSHWARKDTFCCPWLSYLLLSLCFPAIFLVSLLFLVSFGSWVVLVVLPVLVSSVFGSNLLPSFSCSYMPHGLVQLPWNSLSCGKGYHAPELYCWFLHSLNPQWTGSCMMRINIAGHPSPHHPHTGRHLHTFAPMPSSPANPTLLSHGGIPSHMILNPEPNLRPLSTRPPENSHPSNTARSRSSRGESSNQANLPIHSTTRGDPHTPGTENPPINPEARPKKKQRVHVTVSESNPITITAPALTLVGSQPTEFPTTDESDSLRPLQSSIQSQSKTATGCSDKSGRFRFGTTSPISFSGTSSWSWPVNDPVLPPPSTINHSLRPWAGSEDHELISYKSDTRARPAWKTIGFRLKRDPEACKARWLWLRQNRPELDSHTEPEAED